MISQEEMQRRIRILKDIVPKHLWEGINEAADLLYREHSHIERLVSQVRARLGVFDKIKLIPDFIAASKGAKGYMGMAADGELIYGPGITQDLTDDMIRGIIAHELGHHINGDPQRKWEQFGWAAKQGLPDKEIQKLQKPYLPQFRQQEYEADKVASQFGYGPGLIKVLEWAQRDIGDGPENGEDTHPLLSDRIARLRQYDKERKAA